MRFFMKLVFKSFIPLTMLAISAGACLPGPITPSPAPFVPQPTPINALVYFVSTGRYAIGVEPYEEPVARQFPGGVYLPDAVLQAYFEGPNEEEQARGLEAITSGFSGVRQMEVRNATAHVYLEGTCTSHGAAYNVSQLLMVNLLQFPEIQAVKIYDEHGETGDPDGPGSSIPFCLEP
jgi:hypothetical protein